MLTEKQVNEVKKLLRENYSFSEIRAATGISIYSIQTIKAGIWDKRNEVKKRSKARQKNRIKSPNTTKDPVFCKVCKAMVYEPCVTCQLRKRKNNE